MNFRNWTMTVIAALLIALIGQSTSATTVMRMDFPQLVHDSDTIVQGHVDQVYSQWDAEKKMIFTYVAVRVVDPIKGAPHGVVTVRHLGGAVGSLNMSVVGMPSFKADDDVLLFLKNNDDGTYHIVGLGQGKYSIAGSVAMSSLSGVNLVDRQMREIPGTLLVDREPLETFKARIRGMLK